MEGGAGSELQSFCCCCTTTILVCFIDFPAFALAGLSFGFMSLFWPLAATSAVVLLCMPPRAFVRESSEGIKQLVRWGKGGRAVAFAFTILYYKQGCRGLGRRSYLERSNGTAVLPV